MSVSTPQRSSKTRSSQARFEARRLAIERRAGLRRLQLVLGLALVATLAVGVIAFINSSAFDVDEIVVTGNDRADPQLVVDASGIVPGQALLEVDLDAAVDQVELVPWVGTATVTRGWRGTIEIAIVERGPSAVLTAGNRFTLVDDHGRQLDVVDERPEGYMPVHGIEGSGVPGEAAPAVALPVIALLEALPPSVEEQIEAVVFEGDQLYLDLAIGGRARFGDGTQLDTKLQALETMLATVDLRCLDTVDVRVPAAPVLTRSGDPVAGSDAEGGDPATDDPQTNPRQEPDSASGDC